MNNFEIFKKSGRGGYFKCLCETEVYLTAGQVKKYDRPFCNVCKPKKAKAKKGWRKRFNSRKERDKFRELRQDIINKRKKCESCLFPSELHIHHIDEDYTNNNENNLLLLCKWCHADEHPNLENLILS